MSVDWGGYTPFDPPVAKPFHEMTRPEATANFDAVVGAIGDRLSALRGLLATNGVVLPGDLGPGDLEAIDAWYRGNVAGDAATGLLVPFWHGVAHDIGLYLGQCLIARSPWLRWELVTRPRSDFAFHRAAVAGFRRAGHDLHVDPCGTAVAIGYGAAFDPADDDEDTHRLPARFETWSRLA